MSTKFLFTSEHVTEGHPDKVCDQISDAILDTCLQEDSASKVACEVVMQWPLVFVMGEISSTAQINIPNIVRDTLTVIGGYEYANDVSVIVDMEHQSPEIANVTDYEDEDNLGAGDQGLMFGYATNETDTLLPLSYELARNLAVRMSECRRKGICTWLHPEAKTQVTIEYEVTQGAKQFLKPVRVHEILISVQRTPDITVDRVYSDMMQYVVLPTIPMEYIDVETKYHIGWGARAKAGATGRKQVVDTYGGWGGCGGGALSGKDPTKVDRSGSYAARWIAKSLVAAGLVQRCAIQLAYAIGISDPVSVTVNSYGTGKYDDDSLLKIINANFCLRPHEIIKELDLRRPTYYMTARFGHFGRKNATGFGGFAWEEPKRVKIPSGMEPRKQ
jgi:S-adenosylmethionine synthetase